MTADGGPNARARHCRTGARHKNAARAADAFAKRYARSRGVSLSSLIEQSLRQAAGVSAPTFSARWRGKFKAAERKDDPRYNALARKYLH